MQVINGDWNWILPGKFIAFSGPTCRRREQSVYGTLGAEDYVPLWQAEGVSAVVRLNKAVRACGNYSLHAAPTASPNNLLHA
jgi:cell division cycle 14